MRLLSRKHTLAIAAVIDVALNARERPVSAKALADRQQLPPRHLEPLLQALVRSGILKGVRGPHGGYALGRDQARITADEILRVAAATDDADEPAASGSVLLERVVEPALAQAERGFSTALAAITIADMARVAERVI